MNDHLPPLTHAPDGLYESDVDALISEYFPADPAPRAVVDKAAVHRHVRRINRRTIGIVFLARSIGPDADDAAA